LIYMTDNGTAGVPVLNSGMRGRKTQVYEGRRRVPCFLRWPPGKAWPLNAPCPERQRGGTNERVDLERSL
jgi:hypothetical protein